MKKGKRHKAGFVDLGGEKIEFAELVLQAFDNKAKEPFNEMLEETKKRSKQNKKNK